MEGLPETSEEYHARHERTLTVRDGDTILYSIDTYMLLPRLPEAAECMESERVGVKLCYARASEECELVIVVSPERVELVNLRLITREAVAPAEARERCAREARRIAEVLRPAQRGEG